MKITVGKRTTKSTKDTKSTKKRREEAYRGEEEDA
jgi:hypothetical protein